MRKSLNTVRAVLCYRSEAVLHCDTRLIPKYSANSLDKVPMSQACVAVLTFPDTKHNFPDTNHNFPDTKHTFPDTNHTFPYEIYFCHELRGGCD